MTFSLSPAEILTVIAGTTAMITGLFHAAMYVGKLTVRVEMNTVEIKVHDGRLGDHDAEFRFLKGLDR